MIGLLLAVVALAAEPSAELCARATGRFLPTEPAAAIQARLDVALERSIQTMTWAWRPVARPRLMRSVDWCRAWHTALDDERFSVRCVDDQTPLEVPLDGEGMTVPDDEGESMDVSLQLNEEGVDLCMSSHKATYCSRFWWREGGLLEVKTTLDSRHFGVPVVHRVRYARSGE